MPSQGTKAREREKKLAARAAAAAKSVVVSAGAGLPAAAPAPATDAEDAASELADIAAKSGAKIPKRTTIGTVEVDEEHELMELTIETRVKANAKNPTVTAAFLMMLSEKFVGRCLGAAGLNTKGYMLAARVLSHGNQNDLTWIFSHMDENMKGWEEINTYLDSAKYLAVYRTGEIAKFMKELRKHCNGKYEKAKFNGADRQAGALDMINTALKEISGGGTIKAELSPSDHFGTGENNAVGRWVTTAGDNAFTQFVAVVCNACYWLCYARTDMTEATRDASEFAYGGTVKIVETRSRPVHPVWGRIMVAQHLSWLNGQAFTQSAKDAFSAARVNLPAGSKSNLCMIPVMQPFGLKVPKEYEAALLDVETCRAAAASVTTRGDTINFSISVDFLRMFTVMTSGREIPSGAMVKAIAGYLCDGDATAVFKVIEDFAPA